MNSAALLGAFGRLLVVLAAAHLPPFALALAEADAEAARAFALGAACTLFPGGVLVLVGRGGARRLERRDALTFAVAGWGVAGLFAAVPFMLSGAADFSGSVLEAVSGVTASGLGAIERLDEAPRAILLWRAILQWIGGYATLVFVSVLAPRIALSAPAPEAFRPRPRQVASAAAALYAVLTAAAGAALAAAGAPPLQAACYAMSGISTGGFAAGGGGPAALGHGVEAVLMLTMAAGALNLLGAWRAGAARAGADDTELAPFLAFAAAGAGVVAVVLAGAGGVPVADTAWRGLFAAVSALTTTGFSAGFEAPAPVFVILALAGLALVGGAGGSTAGGLKLRRALLLLRRSRHELERLAHPHRVVPIRVGRVSVSEADMRGVWAFFVLFILFLVVLATILAAHGLGLVSATVLALSALTNTGPLLAEAAAAVPDLAALGWSGDIAIALGMLIGRLEILAFFVVLTPLFWRR